MQFLVWRIVEQEAKSQSRKTTDSPDEYEFLESYIDSGKPPYPNTGHHVLVATAFRYEVPTPPDFVARFKPPFGNPKAFYSSLDSRTSCYETAYHFMKERVHLPSASQTPEPRTLFSVAFSGPIFDIATEARLPEIISRKSMEASWDFVRNNPNVNSVLYPSCRDPDHGQNVFTKDISSLEKNPKNYTDLRFIFESQNRLVRILDRHEDPAWETLTVGWDEVS